jgi:hypothetical protein
MHISDNALVEAAVLSDRYLADRYVFVCVWGGVTAASNSVSVYVKVVECISALLSDRYLADRCAVFGGLVVLLQLLSLLLLLLLLLSPLVKLLALLSYAQPLEAAVVSGIYDSCLGNRHEWGT